MSEFAALVTDAAKLAEIGDAEPLLALLHSLRVAIEYAEGQEGLTEIEELALQQLSRPEQELMRA